MSKKIFKGYKSNKQHSIDMRRSRRNKKEVAQIRAMQLKDQMEKLKLLEDIKRLRAELNDMEDDDE